uniref:SecDF P1 head subdomain-containing protein n=1 Tax=Phocaeicola coprocola TaxID=310298 RepID=UPI004038F910
FHRTNGWYYVTSQTTDSLSQTPFLTVKDFDTLRLETDAFGRSVITGVFLQDKLPIWREATTKSVGKYIAFVFKDTVITAPQVNSPIESGCFQISNPHGYDLERIFRELQKKYSYDKRHINK